jgi:hypothetical protein
MLWHFRLAFRTSIDLLLSFFSVCFTCGCVTLLVFSALCLSLPLLSDSSGLLGSLIVSAAVVSYIPILSHADQFAADFVSAASILSNLKHIICRCRHRQRNLIRQRRCRHRHVLCKQLTVVAHSANGWPTSERRFLTVASLVSCQ